MNRLLFASSLALAACGGSTTANQKYAPTLVTLSGTISSSTLPKIPDHVRVALVWPTATADQEAESVDVPLTAALPVRYVLDVTTPPPASSLQRVPADEATKDGIDPSTFQFAVGNVVAYVDANGNGKRDAASEQVIAMPDTVIYYIEGSAAPALAATGGGNREDSIPVGFSLIGFEEGGIGSDGSTILGSAVVTPISSDIDLELEPQAQPAGLLCATGFGADATAPTSTLVSQAETLPPAGAVVFCSTDGEIYQWTLCTGNLCDESCTAGSGQVDPTSPPAGYPCTVNPAE